MRMTEKNVKKTLKDYAEVLDKLSALLGEMGIEVETPSIPVEVVGEGESATIGLTSDKRTIVPLSYLLDKAGTHQDEYTEELNKKKEAEKSLSIFRNSFSKAL